MPHNDSEGPEALRRDACMPGDALAGRPQSRTLFLGLARVSKQPGVVKCSMETAAPPSAEGDQGGTRQKSVGGERERDKRGGAYEESWVYDVIQDDVRRQSCFRHAMTTCTTGVAPRP